MRRLRHVISFIALLFVVTPPFRAAETLPDHLSDTEFWKIVESVSEPDGVFPAENFVSNEMKYGDAIRDLQKATQPGGVYLGVGPEQNFNYIGALKPRIAFIIDIRRQNLVEHLMYRALFELSMDRAEFLSRLFSRKLPSSFNSASPSTDLLNATKAATADLELYRKNLQDIRTLLISKHGFKLTSADETALQKIYQAFFDNGPAITYGTGTSPGVVAAGVAAARGNNTGVPTFADLMTVADSNGANWSFLDSDVTYQSVRDMELRNLIIPVVGDFAGPKAIRGVGEYLREHGETVRTLYASNVETYLFISTTAVSSPAPNGGWKTYFENVSTLPLDASSTIVRFQGAIGPGLLYSIQDNLKAVQDGSLNKLGDLYRKTN